MSIDNENPDLLMPVKRENELKTWLVNYVGNKLQPKGEEISVEMIIKVMAEDFPEFLMPVAEENFIRGYRQAIVDLDQK